jgi:tetratricopeptide (TPR) repeat protein
MPAPLRRVDELGFPLPASFDDSNNSPARRTWGQIFYRHRWWLLLLILPLLFGQSLVTGIRKYVAHQFVQAAWEQHDHEEFSQALASADRALFWQPDSFEKWQAYYVRAWTCEDLQGKLAESFDNWGEVIHRLDDPAHAKPQSARLLRAAYTHRAWVAERLGRHREAIVDSNMSLKLGGDDAERAILLNQRAYIRALANVELKEALADVDQSLQIRSDAAEVIDTRAYILYRLGNYEAALKEINEAIQWTQSVGTPARRRADNGPHIWFQDDDDSGAQQNQIYWTNLAVMYHHRGEIRKKLGQQAEGDQDIRRAGTYGYNRERGVF